MKRQSGTLNAERYDLPKIISYVEVLSAKLAALRFVTTGKQGKDMFFEILPLSLKLIL